MSSISFDGSCAPALLKGGFEAAVPAGNTKLLTSSRESVDSQPDGRALRVHLLRYSRAIPVAGALQAEILVLRHQLNILRRKSPKRVALGKIDRLVFCGLYRLSPTVLDALKILQPETVIRWHRAGFRAYWRWRSRPRGGCQGSPRTFATSFSR
jgi:hypothetical protein